MASRRYLRLFQTVCNLSKNCELIKPIRSIGLLWNLYVGLCNTRRMLSLRTQRPPCSGLYRKLLRWLRTCIRFLSLHVCLAARGQRSRGWTVTYQKSCWTNLLKASGYAVKTIPMLPGDRPLTVTTTGRGSKTRQKKQPTLGSFVPA